VPLERVVADGRLTDQNVNLPS